MQYKKKKLSLVASWMYRNEYEKEEYRKIWPLIEAVHDETIIEADFKPEFAAKIERIWNDIQTAERMRQEEIKLAARRRAARRKK